MSDGGERLEEWSLRYALDASTLDGKKLDLGGDPDEVCALLAGFGISCGPCPVSKSEHCVDVALSGQDAERLEEVTMVEVTAQCE